MKEIQNRIDLISTNNVNSVNTQNDDDDDEWEETSHPQDHQEEEEENEMNEEQVGDQDENNGNLEITITHDHPQGEEGDDTPTKKKRNVLRRSKGEHRLISIMNLTQILLHFNFNYRLNEYIRNCDDIKGIILSLLLNQDIGKRKKKGSTSTFNENIQMTISECIDFIYDNFKIKKISKKQPNLLKLFDHSNDIYNHVQNLEIHNIFELYIVVMIVLIYMKHVVRFVTVIDPLPMLKKEIKKKGEIFIDDFWLEVFEYGTLDDEMNTGDYMEDEEEEEESSDEEEEEGKKKKKTKKNAKKETKKKTKKKSTKKQDSIIYRKITLKNEKSFKNEKVELKNVEKYYKKITKKSCEYPIFVYSFDYNSCVQHENNTLQQETNFNYIISDVTPKHFICKYPNTYVGKENYIYVQEEMNNIIQDLNRESFNSSNSSGNSNNNNIIIEDEIINNSENPIEIDHVVEEGVVVMKDTSTTNIKKESSSSSPSNQQISIIEKDNIFIQNIITLVEMEIPQSIQEFQTHPIYIIEKFISKYDGIYPKDIDPVSVVKTHNVYLRSSLKPLHTRDRWLRDSMLLVREGEKPYKIVKASKFSKSAEFTNLFGEWQTDPYIVPSVSSINDPIPKSEKGVYELWNSNFLPNGCSHISTANTTIKGLTNVARKLDIDYARAMIGFEIRQKRSVPKYDGIIVHSENEQVLREAYVEYEKKRLEKLQKKKDERIMGNWSKLVRGLLAREYVEKKYGNRKEQVFLTDVIQVQDGDDNEQEEDENTKKEPSPQKVQRVLGNGRIVEFEEL